MATITKLPSGKFRAQVRRAGIYKAKTFARKLDATSWAADVERAVESGSQTGLMQAPATMTFGDVIDAYLKAVTIDKAGHPTLEAVARVIGDVPIRDLNMFHLQRWIDQRQADGVTGATIARNIGLISGVLKWARHSKHIDVDADLGKKAHQSLAAARVRTSSTERDRIPTEAELAKLRAFFADRNELKLAMADLMDFALATGMRLGEICSITFEDWRQNEGAILVRDRKDPKVKIGNNQVVPLLPTATAIIRRRADETGGTGRVFPFAPNTISVTWRLATKECGIDDLRFHDLRHAAITDLFRMGLSIQEVALFSGHKTWTQLRRYTQLTATDIHARLAQLGAAQ